ncbi:MAG TPA: ORF6N domain-containing protein, partial [Bacteroidia bacterium]|nr:ORF6N domain-containing protein [Bacteroidia bacterium]
YCFTEQGVTMLSAVLKSRQAVEVNIRIVRLFVRLREVVSSNKEIARNLEQLEKVVGNHSKAIEEIFSVLKQLINPEPVPRKRVGYKMKKED